MIYDSTKHFYREIRALHLECLEIALREYDKTNDKDFIEYIKYFGEASSKLKRRFS